MGYVAKIAGVVWDRFWGLSLMNWDQPSAEFQREQVYWRIKGQRVMGELGAGVVERVYC